MDSLCTIAIGSLSTSLLLDTIGQEDTPNLKIITPYFKMKLAMTASGPELVAAIGSF